MHRGDKLVICLLLFTISLILLLAISYIAYDNIPLWLTVYGCMGIIFMYIIEAKRRLSQEE